MSINKFIKYFLKFVLTLMLCNFIFIKLSFAKAVSQTITAECTTKGTDTSGARNSCDSDVTKLEAQTGFVFSEKSLQGGETSGNGSEHECRIGWDNYVEVIPDSEIKQPRTITLQAHSTSPGGMTHGGERGWAKCIYTVKLSKYQ